MREIVQNKSSLKIEGVSEGRIVRGSERKAYELLGRWVPIRTGGGNGWNLVASAGQTIRGVH